jgi:hypothetical protein
MWAFHRRELLQQTASQQKSHPPSQPHLLSCHHSPPACPTHCRSFANLLLQTLPPNHGIILVNTGVGGTGFHDGRWVAPDGPLAVQCVTVVQALFNDFPALGGTNLSLHSMLWHQGEEDAGDNRGLRGAAGVRAAGDFFETPWTLDGALPSNGATGAPVRPDN